MVVCNWTEHKVHTAGWHKFPGSCRAAFHNNTERRKFVPTIRSAVPGIIFQSSAWWKAIAKWKVRLNAFSPKIFVWNTVGVGNNDVAFTEKHREALSRQQTVLLSPKANFHYFSMKEKRICRFVYIDDIVFVYINLLVNYSWSQMFALVVRRAEFCLSLSNSPQYQMKSSVTVKA